MVDARADYEIRTKNSSDKAFDEVTAKAQKLQSAMAALEGKRINLAADEKPVNRLTSALGSLVTRFGPLAAAATAAFGWKRLVEDHAKALDDLNDRALRLGIAVDQLDRLEFAARQSGVEVGELANAAKLAQRNLAEAASTGKGATAEALAFLGLKARDSQGRIKDFNRILLEVAERFPSVASESKKTALAMDIFGRSGDRLIPVLNAGADELRRMLLDAEQLGTVYPELARKADAYEAAQDRLSRAWRNAKNAIADVLLPPLTDLKNFMANALAAAFDTPTEKAGRFVQAMKLQGVSPDEILGQLRSHLEATGEAISAVRAKLDGLWGSEVRSEQQRSLALQAELNKLLNDEAATTSQIAAIMAELNKLSAEGTAADEDRARAARRAAEAAAVAAVDAAQRWGVKVFEVFDQLQKKEQAFVVETVNTFAVTGQAIDDILEGIKVNLDFTPQLQATGKGWDDLDRAAATVADTMSRDMGDAMFNLKAQGELSATLFQDAWKHAIANVAADLTERLVKRGLIDVIGSFIPGFGALFGSASGAALAGSPVVVQQTFQSFTPPTTDDFVRAHISAQEAAIQANRFLVGAPA